MPQILASSKTGADKYDLKSVNPNKVLPRLDARQIAQSLQRSYEETQGYSLSGDEGSSDAIVTDLSDITVGDIGDYNQDLSRLIQTYVANNSYLALDPSSTANSLILIPRKIGDINSPNGANYSKNTSLPFTYRDNLSFTFRAALDNTNAVQVSIPDLDGLVGSIDLVDEGGNALPAKSILENRFYRIVLTGTSGTKKAVLADVIKATLPEAITGTQENKFLTPYLASNLPAFRASKATSQTLSNGVWTKITPLVVDFDIGSYWDSGAQKLVPPAGKYQINLGINATSNQSYGCAINLYKNGSASFFGLQLSGVANQQNKTIYSDIMTTNGTDEFEIYCLIFGTGTLTLQETFFSIFKVR